MAFPTKLSGVESQIFTPIILSSKRCEQFSALSRNPFPMSILSNRSSPPRFIPHLHASLVLDVLFIHTQTPSPLDQVIEASLHEAHKDWFYKKKTFLLKTLFSGHFQERNLGIFTILSIFCCSNLVMNIFLS